MPGHRREYDGQFAQIEVGFILNDPRCTGMTSPEFRYYIFVWCLAVKERSELLPSYWDAASLQRHCSLDTRTGRKCRANLLQKCLLEESHDGRLRVCGVKSKHPNLKWKDDRLEEPKGPLNHPKQKQKQKQKQKIETEGGKTTAKAVKENTTMVMATEFVQKYHDLCPSLSRCLKITDARRKAINQRLADLESLQITVVDFLNKCEAADWLAGRNDKGWKADIDFITTKSKFLKIAEGFYGSGKAQAAAHHETTGPTSI